MNIEDYADIYRRILLNDIIPFWLNNSIDQEFGGYFTCLDRCGNVFDTDKFVWLQARQVWTFAMLYNQVEKKQRWLDVALRGAGFLAQHGRDEVGKWYFSLTREGDPLIQPYNIFSDCFAAMAFGQLYKATSDPEHGRVAKGTFFNILRRRDKPKGKYTKEYPGTRDLLGLALPMILSNLVLELEHLLEPETVEKLTRQGIEAATGQFYRPELGVILEHIGPDGDVADCFEGRLVNPGHGLEAMWFMMDLAKRNDDDDLMETATGIAMAKGYLHTEGEQCWEWFKRLHQYSWDHFADQDHGEWYGYLNRQGDVLLDLKGGGWKGCFHEPRAFYQIWTTLDEVAAR